MTRYDKKMKAKQRDAAKPGIHPGKSPGKPRQLDAGGCTLSLTAADSWFFRESRPMNAAGGQILNTRFPPPAITVAGALRSWFGDALAIDWTRYRRAAEAQAVGKIEPYPLGELPPGELKQQWMQTWGETPPRTSDEASSAIATSSDSPSPQCIDLLGAGGDLGCLKLRGPWLVGKPPGSDQQSAPAPRLYAVPAAVLCKKGKEDEAEPGMSWLLLKPAGDEQTAILSDLGRVRLPAIAAAAGEALSGYGAADDYVVTREGLYELLQGKTRLQPALYCRMKDLWQPEDRLGIALNQSTRSVEKSALYQTRHIRLLDARETQIEVDLYGTAPLALPPDAWVRLGGEARLAHVACGPATAAAKPLLAPVPENATGLLLVLLTAACVDTTEIDAAVMLPGFTRQPQPDGFDVWQGQINGCDLLIESLACQRPVREGGWSMAQHRSRPVQQLLPAGTTWYARPAGDQSLNDVAKALAGHQIGLDTAVGRGELAVGFY